MSKNYDFGLVETVEEKETRLGNVVRVWSREVVNNKGEKLSLEIRNEALVDSLEAVDKLTALGNFASIGMAYELASMLKNGILDKTNGIGSIAELGASAWGLKPSTATQYARIGKHFIERVDGENGISYKFIDELPKGTTITNLVQCLSLVHEKDEEPLKDFWEAVESGKITLNGKLANLKKEMKALSDSNVVEAEGVRELSSEKVAEKDNNDIDTIIEKLLDYVASKTNDDLLIATTDYIEVLKSFI